MNRLADTRNATFAAIHLSHVCPVCVAVDCHGASSVLSLAVSCLYTGKEITVLMQTLNTLSTPEEKLAGLCKKYAELVSIPPPPNECVYS